jgi:hypothetical protein
MHNSYFVLVSNEDADTSKEARILAEQILDENSFSYAEGGYFAGGRCDWYVVGGRFSGILPVLDKVDGYFQKTGDKDPAMRQKVWEDIGGRSHNPYQRDSYNSDGYEDDAMMFDEPLAARLYESKTYHDTEVFDTAELNEITVKELLENKDQYLNKYWLVVIDCHN